MSEETVFQALFKGELPPAKKNRTVIARAKNGRHFILPSPKVRHYQDMLHQFFHLKNPGKHPNRGAVTLEITVCLDEKWVNIEVHPVPVPESLEGVVKGRDLCKVGGKLIPDLVNMPAVIADALEGVAYVNDKQIVSLSVEWY